MEGMGGTYSGQTERPRRGWAGDGWCREIEDRGGRALVTKPEPWVMRQQVPTAPLCQTLLQAWGSQEQGPGEKGGGVSRQQGRARSKTD